MRKIFIITIFVLLLNGCAGSLVNLRKDFTLDKSGAGNSLVFGEIDCRNCVGREVDFKLINLKNGQGRKLRVLVKRSGFVFHFEPTYFFIELPEGNYQVHKILNFNGNSWVTGDVNIKFLVPPGRVVYIGTLQFDVKSKIRFPLIEYYDILSQKIIDDRESAANELRKQYPNVTNDVQVNLAEAQQVEKKNYWETFKTQKK